MHSSFGPIKKFFVSGMAYIVPSDPLVDEPDYLEFRDPYQITWQTMFPGSKFRTAGEFANRWLKL